MKISVRSILFALSLEFLLLLAPRADAKAGWMDHQPRALAEAKATNKLLLMDFTGSDWCPWCVKFDREIFATAEFKAYAKDHLVLVELDFPNAKPIAIDVLRQNLMLQQRYGVETFPTQIVLDGNGNVLKVFTGYPPGGAREFIDALKKIRS